MKNKTSTILNIVFCLMFIIFAGFSSKAQQYNTLHWMHGIPQSIYSNPGIKPDATIYVGTPALSSMYFGFSSTGFKPSDLIRKNDDGTFYMDHDNVLSKLRKNNYIGIDYQHELIAFGFSMDDSHFSFNITEKVGARIGYPKDFMTLMLKGNEYFREKDIIADFSGIGLNGSHYREYGFGYSRQWLNELSAGARAKLLFGKANVNFDKTNISVYTHPETFAISFRSDVLINTSLPINIEVDEDKISELELGSEVEFYPGQYLTNPGNFGLALDVGGVYDIDERFSVAFSIIDLGFINWKSDVSNIGFTGDFDFEGLDLDISFDDDLEDDRDFGEILSDTLNQLFDFYQTNARYSTMLPTKFILSGTYNIGDIHKAGFMARGEVFGGSFYPSFTLAYSIQPIPFIGATLSYSVIHNNFSNLGLGMHFNLRHFQIYLVTDNFIPSLYPHTIQSTSVQLGLNWIIKHRNQNRAEPLYSW